MNETYKAIELSGLGNSRKQESHSVQYARHMGFEVVAIARGTNTPELAKKLGAHHYIDSAATDPAEGLQALGGAQVILITESGGKTTAATFKGLGNHIAIDSGRRPVV